MPINDDGEITGKCLTAHCVAPAASSGRRHCGHCHTNLPLADFRYRIAGSPTNPERDNFRVCRGCHMASLARAPAVRRSFQESFRPSQAAATASPEPRAVVHPIREPEDAYPDYRDHLDPYHGLRRPIYGPEPYDGLNHDCDDDEHTLEGGGGWEATHDGEEGDGPDDYDGDPFSFLISRNQSGRIESGSEDDDDDDEALWEVYRRINIPEPYSDDDAEATNDAEEGDGPDEDDEDDDDNAALIADVFDFPPNSGSGQVESGPDAESDESSSSVGHVTTSPPVVDYVELAQYRLMHMAKKKSKQKPIVTLREALPDIPTEHCPDLVAFQSKIKPQDRGLPVVVVHLYSIPKKKNLPYDYYDYAIVMDPAHNNTADCKCASSKAVVLKVVW
ncbi:Uu.00g126950.m01.CDS01 [Anthostomella pinea]|uniref:Uu.00g126950.m01.CDS01 n=1 Tax=Anthostomella pinea TaxID=933095 RepID=A0AAI8VIM2_9PEZI|nr:Uu.00g126950.m01.CDS01 [Anthostomella pinea]